MQDFVQTITIITIKLDILQKYISGDRNAYTITREVIVCMMYVNNNS